MKNNRGLPRFVPRLIEGAKSKGFTLIELLVVMFIIGLLATIVVVVVSGARADARDARRKADIKSLKTAIELYANDNKQYPNPGAADTSYSMTSLGAITGFNQYISPIPHDPIASRRDVIYPSAQPWDYIYALVSTGGYGLSVTFEQITFTGGRKDCRTGVNVPNNWWNSAPQCDF